MNVLKNSFFVLITLLIASCSNDDDVLKSNAKELTAFTINGNNATINEQDKTVALELPVGTDKTSLSAEVAMSAKATITPDPSVSRDYTDPVEYIITAEDGSTQKYKVLVVIEASTAKELTAFTINGINATINEQDKTVALELPAGTDQTSLSAEVAMSAKATITPDPSQARDYTNSVEFIITAEDGSIQKYVITVSVVALTEREILIALYNANPENTLGWDITNTDISTWQGVTLTDGRITNLSLDRKAINSIPAELGNLTALTELGLGNNSLTSIPVELGNLTKLKELGLYNNLLTDIPKELSKLTNLEELVLNRNSLTSIPAELGNLTNLTTFDLIGNSLTSIPAELGNLTALTELGLGNNSLTSIPSTLGNLTKLKTLRLGNNALTSIPIELGSLTNLEQLYLSRNALTNIPVTLGDLTALTVLELQANLLTSIPTELSNLTTLTYLDMSSNLLTDIPTELGNFKSLNLLILSYNSLKSIPAELGSLKVLAWFDLSHNSLTDIPVELGNLTTLDLLRLNNNPLTTIPLSVCDLENTGTYIRKDTGVTCE